MATYTPEQARAELARRAEMRQYPREPDKYVQMLSDARQQTPMIEPVQRQPGINFQRPLEITAEQARAELDRRLATGKSVTQPEPAPSIEQQIAEQAKAEGRPLDRTDEEKKLILAERLAQPGIGSKIMSGMIGAGQGATMGFADELSGLGNMSLGTALTNPGNLVNEYRQGRDESRVVADMANKANPNSYMGGELAGGLVAAASPGGVPATFGRAALTGAAVGGAAALGSSRSDLTKAEVGQASKDALIGGAMGAALGPVALGVGRGMGAVVNRFRPQAAAAEAVASKAAQSANEIEAATQAGTQKSFYEQSMQLQDESSKMLGEPFRFRPGQSTGSPDLALAEMKAANFPRTMTAAQLGERKQTEQSAKILDMYVDKVAADPEALGRSDVGNGLVTTVENHISALAKERSSVAGPLYQQAAELAGGKRIIPTDATQQAMSELLDANRFAPAKITSQVRESLLKIQDAASKTGRLKIDDMQNLRALWNSVKRGDVNIIDGLSEANQSRIARNVLSAIDSDLETASNGAASGAAADALKMANKAWSDYSKPIDEAATDTVKRLLKVSGDAGDTITTRLLSSSPDQVSGVFRVLNKADPGMARQLRAQLLDDILTKAGKPLRAGSISAEEGVSRFSPLMARNKLVDAEPQLMAAFTGDNQAQFALRRSFQLLKRLSFGPGIKGSTTAPQLAQVMQETGNELLAKADAGAGGGLTGMAIRKVGKLIMGVLGDDKALNEVYSNPKSIDLFNQALQAQLSGKAPTTYALNAIGALSDTLGLQVGESSPAQPQQPEQPMQEPPRVYARQGQRQ
jgi:hypothetical protein